jgi:hypothetical protein
MFGQIFASEIKLMNDQIIGTLVAVPMLGMPLVILLWLLIKSALVKINRIRSLTYSKHDRKKDINKVILLSIIILILFISIILPVVFAIAPEILSGLPLSLRLFLIFCLFIIYIHTYGCFSAFFMGLRNVVGAGGSARQTIKKLSDYIYEALEINQKKNNHTKK